VKKKAPSPFPLTNSHQIIIHPSNREARDQYLTMILLYLRTEIYTSYTQFLNMAGIAGVVGKGIPGKEVCPSMW